MSRVVVAGSINRDVIITASRYPRRGETMMGEAVSYAPGGKGANQAVAAARSGADSAFVGVVGDDGPGEEARAFLVGCGVDTTHLTTVPGVPTGAAFVVVAESDNSVIVIAGANAHLHAQDVDGVAIAPGDILVAQLEIDAGVVRRFFERGRTGGAKVILNPSPVTDDVAALWPLADVLVLNELEVDDVREQLGELPLSDAQALVVTRGAEGCRVVAGDRVLDIPGRAASVRDTTGAGDCFLGVVAARVAAGDRLEDAAAVANVAAALSVERLGAGSSMPTEEEIRRAQTV